MVCISILVFFFNFNIYFFIGERSGQPGTLKDIKLFLKVAQLTSRRLSTFILLFGWLIIVFGVLFCNFNCNAISLSNDFFDQSFYQTSKLN